MALFAEREILTGEELTYDYNFSNFSQSNVQTCLCESEKCRGIVGRRGKKPSLDERVAMAVKGAMAAGKSAVNAGKRKLKEVLGGAKDEAAPANAKKRKIATPKARTPAKVAEPTPVKSAARSKVFASAAVSTKGGKKTVVAKVTKTAVAAKVVSTPAPAKPGQLKIRFVQKPQVKNMQPQPAPPPVQQRLKLLCKPASPGGGKGANASPVKKSARKAKPTFRFINRTA